MAAAFRDLTAHLVRHRGVVTTRELAALGADSREVRELQRSGRLVRLARGAYAPRELLERLGPEERHTLRVRAVVAVVPGQVAASHHSAVCVWGLPWIGLPPDHVHVMRVAAGEHRRARHYTVHERWPATQPTWVNGVPVLPVPEALLGLAGSAPLEQTVVSGDAALARGLTSIGQLTEVLHQRRGQQGTRNLRSALPLLDARAESPGESRTRLLLHTLGYQPRTQVEIRDHLGHFLARVDALVAGRVVIEFDGRLKYAGDGGGDQQSLVREKAREDRLRAAGYEVVRLVWQDLDAPNRVRQLVDQARYRARLR